MTLVRVVLFSTWVQMIKTKQVVFFITIFTIKCFFPFQLPCYCFKSEAVVILVTCTVRCSTTSCTFQYWFSKDVIKQDVKARPAITHLLSPLISFRWRFISLWHSRGQTFSCSLFRCEQWSWVIYNESLSRLCCSHLPLFSWPISSLSWFSWGLTLYYSHQEMIGPQSWVTSVCLWRVLAADLISLDTLLPSHSRNKTVSVRNLETWLYIGKRR